jgi:glycosyltransferase involved in cell wall biosynthesis
MIPTNHSNLAKPFFSIVTSTLNSESTLDRCLRSVMTQTFTSFEHIISDGASTDNTVKIVQNYQKSYPLILACSLPDSGIYQAWNRAVEASKGEWIIFLGSDDFFLSKRDLEHVHTFISSDLNSKDILFYYCDTIDEKGSLKSMPKLNRISYFRGSTPFPTAVFINRKIFDQGSRFDESYKICADHKFFIQSNFYEHCKHIPIAIYNFSDGGISSRKDLKFLHYMERSRMLTETNKSRPRVFEIYYYMRAKFF